VNLSVFIQGIIIGLTLAAPVGPIALLCIQRTVADGRLHGIVSGIGVATADSFYAAVAFLGLTAISGLIIANQFFFRFLSGIILVLVGIRVWVSLPVGVSIRPAHDTYMKDYLSMLAITLANPLTIIFFVAILPGFGVVLGRDTPSFVTEFVTGVFCGSAAWWVLLCSSLGSVRSRISAGSLKLINHISGLMICCFGAVMLLVLFLPGITGPVP
jgi:threonine/homoserine/homoserine lactone efflux protein